MKSITIQRAAEILAARDNYLILTHVRPDGDTTGCAAGLCRALRQLGKTAYVLENPDLSSLFTGYVDGLLAPADFEPDTVVAVDMASRNMFPNNARQYLDRVDLTIDHHGSQEFYARETCLEADRAACGEIIWEICTELGVMSADIAVPLYVAVSTDCGCFVYSNTTPHTHRVAAALMEQGIDFKILNKKHFRTKTFKRLQLESRLVQGMELRNGGETALVFLTRELIDGIGADERDMEDISAFIGPLEGVKNSVTLKETVDGHVKISMRTGLNSLNASQVCALLGGGGHAAAAGAMVKGTMEEVRQRVIDAIEQVRNG